MPVFLYLSLFACMIWELHAAIILNCYFDVLFYWKIANASLPTIQYSDIRTWITWFLPYIGNHTTICRWPLLVPIFFGWSCPSNPGFTFFSYLLINIPTTLSSSWLDWHCPNDHSVIFLLSLCCIISFFMIQTITLHDMPWPGNIFGNKTYPKTYVHLSDIKMLVFFPFFLSFSKAPYCVSNPLYLMLS